MNRTSKRKSAPQLRASLDKLSSRIERLRKRSKSGFENEVHPVVFRRCASDDVLRIARTQDSLSKEENGNNIFQDMRKDLQALNKKRRKLDMEAKKERLVDSLIWFSHHIPQAVLEDLVSHEIRTFEQKRYSTKPTSMMTIGDDLPNCNDGDEGLITDSESDSDSIKSCPEYSHGELDFCEGNFEDAIKRTASVHHNYANFSPKTIQRESALLFVDISGFTKLSTMLDVESLSKVINSYFDMLVSEVIKHGGDVLKFAGDAFFAEWKVPDNDDTEHSQSSSSPLELLNASFTVTGSDDFMCSDIPKLSSAVLSAAKCAASFVKQFSDYKVGAADVSGSQNFMPQESTLNLHCGIGAGRLVGLHIGDCKENGEESSIELRREFLILGNPVQQVSVAADVANNGEVFASPQALQALAYCCKGMPNEIRLAKQPTRIACRDETMFPLVSSLHGKTTSYAGNVCEVTKYASLRAHCLELDHAALTRLHLQIALYVHPVIRDDELALSVAMRTENSMQPIQSRHLAEAELRSVYTVFIKAMLSPELTCTEDKNQLLFTKLGDIMHVVSRELGRYRGHLRQFIVDDKGVVMIATFGLRGSTSPNMISNNCLPATFSIHKALKFEVGIESRIGATFGKVYCGVVGGIRRHEFAVMGAPVNLAARLMASEMNRGILVDEAVRAQADVRYAFHNEKQVKAKGYDKPVNVAEPQYSSSTDQIAIKSVFVGRAEEMKRIVDIARNTMNESEPQQNSMVVLMGECGIGKSSLGQSAIKEIKKEFMFETKKIFVGQTPTCGINQQVPFSSLKKVFLDLLGGLSNSHVTNPPPECPRRRRKKKKRISMQEFLVGTADSAADLSVHENSFSRNNSRRASYHLSMRNSRLDRLSASSEGALKPRLRRGSLFSGEVEAGMGTMRLNPTRRTRARSTNNVTYQEDSDDEHEPVHSMGDDVASTDAGLLHKKLCWISEKIGYGSNFADAVGSQCFNLHGARTQNFNVTCEDFAEFLTAAFVFLSEKSDLTVIFVDDLQSIDSFSWKTLQNLSKAGQKLLIICAVQLNDKMALQRLSGMVSDDTQLDIAEITLGPLDFLEIRTLIAGVLETEEDTVDDILCADVYQRTLGLPLHAVELLQQSKANERIVVGDDKMLRWTPEAAKEQLKSSNFGSAAVIEETFQSHFDALDVRVRKILQTCAVLGMSFSLSDVVRIHPELEELGIESALDTAVVETILTQISPEDFMDREAVADSFFTFSHRIWRERVLKTMLEERKVEIYRRIEKEAEKDEKLELEQEREISRRFSLFEYWKSSGHFVNAATIALTLGSELEQIDDLSRSLAVYTDALGLSSWSTVNIGGDCSKPTTQAENLSLSLRLMIRIGLCHSHLGDEHNSIRVFEDAYKILETLPNIPAECVALLMPVLATLTTLKFEHQLDDQTPTEDLMGLLQIFAKEAREQESPVHICRALSMSAMYSVQQGQLERAIAFQSELDALYDAENHSEEMVELYGHDYAAECTCESALWYFVVGRKEEAERRIETILECVFPFHNPSDVSGLLSIALPVIEVLKLLDRGRDADRIFKKLLDLIQENEIPGLNFWLPMLFPLGYLLDVVKMEEECIFDDEHLNELEEWVVTEENSVYPVEVASRAHLWMGELCCRLASLKSPDDAARAMLFDKAASLLAPVAMSHDREGVSKLLAITFLESFQGHEPMHQRL